METISGSTQARKNIDGIEQRSCQPQTDSLGSEENQGNGLSEALSLYLRAIESFKPLFSRTAAFAWFAVVMIGLLLRQDHLGISSVIRWLALPTSCYQPFLHFFHSTAWNLQGILKHWWFWLPKHADLMTVGSRMILLGDHTLQPKDGRCMPGVTTLFQDSETASKPGYFRGHKWGFVGTLLGNGSNTFCAPLWGQIHLGRNDIGEKIGADTDQMLMERPIRMAIGIAKRMGKPAYLVLDAFFATATAFLMAQVGGMFKAGIPLLHIITRAKKSYVGYEDPEPAPKGKRGPKPKYGRKLKLYEVFEAMPERFVESVCQVYDQQERILLLSMDLMWKPLKAKVRFVFAKTSRGCIVLMCSDLGLDPAAILTLYCHRQRIETMFSVLKHVMGGLCYRFWSKYLERQSRRPLKNTKHRRVPDAQYITQIEMTWRAIEGFVNFAAIAQGLLQVVSLQLGRRVWGDNIIWLRTYSRSVASEYVILHLIAREATRKLANVTSHAMLRIIQDLKLGLRGSKAKRPPGWA